VALMSVAEALQRVLANATPLPPETVTLSDAVGRGLAEDLVALRSQPPASMSSMDGYALRAADVARAPVELKIIGEIAAGHPFQGKVGAGDAVRIFTGGVMPEGANAVVIQEQTTRAGDQVTVQKAVAPGSNVRLQGMDFREGAVLLLKGQRLTDRDLMLAAAMNHASVSVHRRPKVAIVGTGDELVQPGGAPNPSQIVYSNGFAITALARNEGADVVDLGIAADRIDDIVRAVRHAHNLGADILVTTGGASVGEHDLVQRALASEGLTLSFWRVALRPGRPMMHGAIDAMHVLGLPGNPVSSYVCAFLFLAPLIRRLTGRADVEPRPEPAILGTPLPPNDERADYLRATLDRNEQGLLATPLPFQDSSLTVPLAKADCLLIREPFAPAAKAGSPCLVLKLSF
jgi:molybdopterin molybdotransferase